MQCGVRGDITQHVRRFSRPSTDDGEERRRKRRGWIEKGGQIGRQKREKEEGSVTEHISGEQARGGQGAAAGGCS